MSDEGAHINQLYLPRNPCILQTSATQGPQRGIQVEVMAMMAYILHEQLGVDEGLLVYDGGRALARYALGTHGEWRDILSHTAVEFPDHLRHVHALAWAGLWPHG